MILSRLVRRKGNSAFVVHLRLLLVKDHQESDGVGKLLERKECTMHGLISSHEYEYDYFLLMIHLKV